jgi:hypothetical protein
MARVACRVAFLVSVVLAIVAMSRPAFATTAPLCDDRGATALAAPPPLEARDVAIHRAHATAASCPCPADDALPLGARVSRSHISVEQIASSADRALPPAHPVLPRPEGADLPTTSATLRTDRGVRYRVERPPRA